MTDLQIDVSALRNAAQGLRNSSGHVPTGAPVDAGGCGSSSVIGAVEEFNMWAMVTFTTLASKLESQASAADAAATEFETREAEIAADAGGTP
ncbi:hypothetical protein PYV02_09695 [Leifsonia sp. H3M29-4]|uniref:hypothetical protein n=1 Tax=Salinibacterium metalliresistens TaxID=3031321 RepID=UPI0023DBCCE0|nr:hypothetical protein [Salinibacterium metalliresistens]MDF1479353.1 hypothetical protein [Salinibacterium metalliresistens]